MKKAHKLVVAALFLLSISTLACRAAAVSEWFATPTPTPTLTPTPTNTPTITPSPTPTETPTPTSTRTPRPTGITTETNDNGSVVLSDYDHKYRLTLPDGWVVIPLSGQDISELVDELAKTNPDFKSAAETFRTLDSDFVRVVALNKDSKFISRGYASNITIVSAQDAFLVAMPIEFITGVFEESMKENGAKVITQGVNTVKSDKGVEVGIIEVEQEAPTAAGGRITVRIKMLMFISGNRLIMVNLTAPSQMISELYTDLDAIAKSVEVIR